MSIDAMKQALAALEGWANHGEWVWPESALEQAKRNTTESITALRAAIEQAQEPVAWISEGGDVSRSKRYMDQMGFKCNPLYTAPRQWQGLTDEEIAEVGHLYDWTAGWTIERFARAIEAKLKEKNT
jgi:hypothetical protein